MTIKFDPNDPMFRGLVQSLRAQGVTEEAARAALENYFKEHGEEFMNEIRAALKTPAPLMSSASVGQSLPDTYTTKEYDDNGMHWLSSNIIEKVDPYIVPEAKRFQVRIFDPVIDEAYMRDWGHFNDPRANQVGTVIQIDMHRATNTSYHIFHVQFEDGETVQYPGWKFERLTKGKA